MHAERPPGRQAESEAAASSTLRAARAELAAFRAKMAAVDLAERVRGLERLDRVYREFPELETERAWSDLLSDCLAAAAPEARDAAMAALAERIPSSRLHHAMMPPEGAGLARNGVAPHLVDVLARLADERGISETAALARVARLAVRRGGQPALAQPAANSRKALLDRAARLRDAAPPPKRPASDRRRGWPSGRLSFTEFLLQWPCEILLADCADEAFVVQAYRAILLRDPSPAETEQWLRLLRDDAMAKPRIIEELLHSVELRKLERRARVIWQGKVFTRSGDPEAAEMPAVIWPAEGGGDPASAERDTI